MESHTKVSALEITVNVFSFALMWTAVFAAGTLFFQAINYYFPDPLSAQLRTLNNFNSPITYSIAALIVSLPLYFLSIRYWIKNFTKERGVSEGRLSRFLTYIILLAASLTAVGDLISLLFNFLQGEFGARFVLKSLVILLLAAHTINFYYHERKIVQYGRSIGKNFFKTMSAVTVVIAIIAIIAGFMVGGSPMRQRMLKFDSVRANDLSMIESNITSFVYDNGTLPTSLSILSENSRYGYTRIADPKTGELYTYEIISEPTENTAGRFKLCGTFELESNDVQLMGSPLTWETHTSGKVCRTREVNQPVLKIKQQQF